MRKYNRIYNKLLADNDDFVGMVAYSIYKKGKIEYIERFIKENEGKHPTEDDLKTFHGTTLLDSSIQGYLVLAENKISDFVTILYEDEVDFFYLIREFVIHHKIASCFQRIIISV